MILAMVRFLMETHAEPLSATLKILVEEKASFASPGFSLGFPLIMWGSKNWILAGVRTVGLVVLQCHFCC